MEAPWPEMSFGNSNFQQGRLCDSVSQTGYCWRIYFKVLEDFFSRKFPQFFAFKEGM
jgi:hypothetical protein